MKLTPAPPSASSTSSLASLLPARLQRRVATGLSSAMAPQPVSPSAGASAGASMPSGGHTAHPPRISQLALLAATLVLLAVAELSIPGGLTPRRVKQRVLAKRVAEKLDIVSATDPNVVEPGGPLPIADIHIQGRVHRGVWLFALDSHLRLLLAWRAPSSPQCPLTWATLAEHAVSNESFADAAARGLSEEARFIARPRVHAVGAPFFYTHSQRAAERPTKRAAREERQWTQAYVILPRGDAVDFRALDDADALAVQGDGELARYQGMSLAEFVRHAVQRPSYFCHAELARWMTSVVPLVVRVLKTRERRLFRGHLRDDWATLVASGSPVCCLPSEHEVPIDTVNVSACGVPCEPSTVDPSDSTALPST